MVESSLSCCCSYSPAVVVDSGRAVTPPHWSALVEAFDLSRVSTHSAILHLEHLTIIARQHLSRELEDPVSLSHHVSQLINLVSLTYNVVPSPELARRLLLFRKGHVSQLSELVSAPYDFVWKRPSVSAAQMDSINPAYAPLCACVIRILSSDEAESASAQQLGSLLRKGLQQEASPTTFPTAMRSLRLALTGQETGPSVADIILCLGLTETRDRLHTVLTA
ncbi:nondiscriminating glutamyl-tRNA synthetase EARS2, mitochondrial-like [Petromyzon marinus]|uniref:nondiscriminating glutamyl-tRNA synthetase EARS2, mitochondrial-like n=1 Tax=Petromyzon marinus TaxID=7757 RepID=UPI003F6FD232